LVGTGLYAIASAQARNDTEAITLPSGVQLALMDFPCATVRISGGDAAAAGAALAEVVATLEAMGPLNVALLGNQVFVFARRPSGERSPLLPALKLGSSEMCGHFHCQTLEELNLAARRGLMGDALSSVSADGVAVWNAVVANLQR
jgi:hypothetical protein